MKQTIISVLFVLGIFIPTSLNSNITQLFTVSGCLLLAVVFIYLLFKQGKVKMTSIINILLINGLLWISTLFTPASDYSFGTAIYFFDLSLLFCLDFKNLDLKIKSLYLTFVFVNIANIVLGLATIMNVLSVKTFIVNFYSDFYNDLLFLMMLADKPVNTFASHSIAGFYHFIFFLLNIMSYQKTKKNIFLIMSLFYTVFLWFLTSNTSYAFLIVSVVIFLTTLFKYKKIFFFSVMISIGLYWLFNSYEINQEISITYQTFSYIFNAQGNGLLSRYAASGNLMSNFNYILNHPFRPVGFGYISELKYGDSGLVEYTLRGSLTLLFAIILGFFIFLRTNLKRKYAYFLFLFFIVFELGFSNLIYYRTLLMLPFMILYLSVLTKTQQKETQE